jgi:prolyl 4-hydroxylase
VAAKVEGADYGVDCSFPIHSTDLQCGDLLGDRKSVYEEYMQGCREHWGEKGAKRCNSNEQDRLAMSRRQPQSMVVSNEARGGTIDMNNWR